MRAGLILVCVIPLLSTFGHAECPSADLTGDCRVDLADLAVMARQWLTEGVPVDPGNLVWVSIDDSGAGMKDSYGNPISRGGFTGEMSRYETTNAQYCEYLNAALDDHLIKVSNNLVYALDDYVYRQAYIDLYPEYSDSQITYSGGTFTVRLRDGFSMGDHPVEVSWYGATAFCDYYGYRLPTEWEWQAVADYDGSYTYGCGRTIDHSKANFHEHGHANPLNLSSYPYTSPVDHYSSYGYGMNDMAGNVDEWTDSINSDGYRGVRGGSWRNILVDFCEVSARRFQNPASTGHGFRVCR